MNKNSPVLIVARIAGALILLAILVLASTYHKDEEPATKPEVKHVDEKPSNTDIVNVTALLTETKHYPDDIAFIRRSMVNNDELELVMTQAYCEESHTLRLARAQIFQNFWANYHSPNNHSQSRLSLWAGGNVRIGGSVGADGRNLEVVEDRE